MTADSSRDNVVRAARRLFGERGYQSVTIREVAAEVGLSPAMVMKLVGSKEQLYADAEPMSPEPYDLRVPRSRMGYELVRRILDRRELDMAEPWARAAYLTHGSPDPDASRASFHASYLSMLRQVLGDDAEGQRRSELVAAMLIGLATAVRTLRLLPAERVDQDGLVEEYGALVQSLIDGAVAAGGDDAAS
jgi:AcrR family transcriptional regulator